MYTHSIEIFNTGHNSHGHFPSISWCLWTRIKCCPESFTDLLYSRLQLVSLEENDKHGFVYLISLKIFKLRYSFNISVDVIECLFGSSTFTSCKPIFGLKGLVFNDYLIFHYCFSYSND